MLYTALLNDEFFVHQRVYYVEATRRSMPADNIWRAKLPVIVETDGKKRTYTNFEWHAKKRMEERSAQSINEYRRVIADVIRNGDNNVYSMTGKDGVLRYVVYNEQTRWLVMLNRFGAIETAYKKTFSKKFKNSLTPLGTVKTFIGDFHER